MGRRSVRPQRLSRREKNIVAKGLIRSPDLCIYCQIRPAVDREHVFARGLFEKPRPDNLPTVPSCVECNSGRGDGGKIDLSMDEEYFQTVLCMTEATQHHPSAMKNFMERIPKRFNRSPGLAHALLSTTRWNEVVNEAGIILPDLKPSFSFDLRRFERVLTKITKGLFFFHMGRPLPIDARVVVAPRMDQHLFEVAKKLMGGDHIGPYQLQDEVVSYKGAATGKDKNETAWLYVFYRSYVALAGTGSAEYVPSENSVSATSH